jgi:acetyl esterase/lipase
MTVGFLVAWTASAAAQEEIPLWPNGAPGFEDRRDEKPTAQDWWVANVHNPTLTVYKPETPNGTAVVVVPGGGHAKLVFNSEGRDPALFLAQHGVTAFALKYRLAREPNTPYTLEKHVREDGLRAMRLVRSRAAEWSVDPKRVGMLGFSAGGEVVALVSYEAHAGDPKAADIVEREAGRPDFQMLVYPGPLFVPDVVPPDAPPLFAVAANDDACCSAPIVKLLSGYRAAQRPVEVHLYAQGDHAFNMGYRTPLKTIRGWPERLIDWMTDGGWLPGR